MSNQLVKIGRARSVWVPPVVKEYTVPRTETVASERWAYLRTEQRYVLPKGWTVIQVADRYGTSLVVLPGRRLVDGGNTEEVWYAPGGLTGPFNVAIHKRQTFASDTYVYYDTVREVLEPGYWKSQEDAPTWSHGARSVLTGVAPWKMEFYAPQDANGVVVGSARAETPQAADARQRITQGFHIKDGQILLWATQAAPADNPLQMLAPLPAMGPQTRLSLESNGTQLTWRVDGTAVATAGDLLAGQPVMMAAALYGAYDYVQDASLELSALQATANLQATPIVLLGDVQNRAHVRATPQLYAHGYSNHLRDARRPQLRASALGSYAVLTDGRKPRVFSFGIPGSVGRAALQATPWMASHGYSEGFASLKVQPLVRLTAAQGPALTDLAAVLARITYGRMGGAGAVAYEAAGVRTRITSTVRRERKASNRLLARSRALGAKLVRQLLAERLGVVVDTSTDRLLDGRLYEVLHAGQRMLVGALLDVQLVQHLQGTDTWTTDRMVDAALLQRLGLSAGADHQMVMQALVRELLGVTVLQDLGAPNQVWSVTDQGSPSEESASYTDYPFTGFANIGGRYFGASDQGLYELEGDSDHGAPIEAVIDMGQRDFESMALKSLANAYVSVNAQAPMRLRVELNGQPYTYTARGAGAQMQTQRIDLGRGLRGHFFGLQLMNTDGADFEVGGMEFVAEESKRRI